MAPHSLVNKTAPSFTLPSTKGDSVTVTPGSTGKPLVIFFYPAANTAVCTAEACSFRDALGTEAYTNSQVEIIGISADSVEKNKKWAEQHKLTFTVLSDTDRSVRKSYGVSSALLGLIDGRYTFVIDKDGTVQGVETSTLSAAAHQKFVDQWLATLKA